MISGLTSMKKKRIEIIAKEVIKYEIDALINLKKKN